MFYCNVFDIILFIILCFLIHFCIVWFLYIEWEDFV